MFFWMSRTSQWGLLAAAGDSCEDVAVSIRRASGARPSAMRLNSRPACTLDPLAAVSPDVWPYVWPYIWPDIWPDIWPYI